MVWSRNLMIFEFFASDGSCHSAKQSMHVWLELHIVILLVFFLSFRPITSSFKVQLTRQLVNCFIFSVVTWRKKLPIVNIFTSLAHNSDLTSDTNNSNVGSVYVWCVVCTVNIVYAMWVLCMHCVCMYTGKCGWLKWSMSNCCCEWVFVIFIGWYRLSFAWLSYILWFMYVGCA